MANSIDFVLPSCHYIPESMWLVVSSMLGMMLQRCWLLLGAFIGVKMLVSTFVDLGEDRFSPASHIKITFQAFLIAIFFLYYKTFLMTFDYLIDSLCFFGPEVVQHTKAQSDSAAAPVNFLMKSLHHMVGMVAGMTFFLTQYGASYFMRYVRAVSLLVLAVLGPLSSLFSLLPGPFRSSFKTWCGSYVHVTCWSITLAIIDLLEKTFVFDTGNNHRMHHGTMLSFAFFIMTFLVPHLTSRIISSVDLGGIVSGIGRGGGQIHQVGKKLMGK